jgi:hypothetical protein
MNKVIGKLISRSNKRKYIKIKRNQLTLLEALLNDGGYSKKYVDKSNNVRYSEHSGHFGISNSSMDRIIVSAKTSREDDDDADILLPLDLKDTYDYEYFFHTHPPTPFPGGRAKDGILYELPSISDIFHFIDHYNMGNTIGSVVIAPEGYYIIYPRDFRLKKIKYDVELEEEIFNKMESENDVIQLTALEKYGSKFTEDYFYKKIANDDEYLNMFNDLVNKYLDNQKKIIIKHRSKDKLTNKWILKDLYLPI